MTEKQRQAAFAAGKKINRLREGKNIKIYTSETIVRIQHTKINSAYRLLCICRDDTAKTIETRILILFREIVESMNREA